MKQVERTSARRIVIVGGGVAGLNLATRLGEQARHPKKLDAEIMLIDASSTHVWKPMLHTVAAGTADVHQQQIAFAEHARLHNFVYVPGLLDGIDRHPDRRRLSLAPIRLSENTPPIVTRRTISYDTLVLAIGSQANDFGTPGVREHCRFIDTQAQAESFNALLRTHILRSISRNEALRIAIVGGGATGVELAAELSRLLEVASNYGDKKIRERLRLTLIESGPRLLTAFPEQISALTLEQLGALRIDVRLNTKVVAAEADALLLGDGSKIPAGLMVWAAGVKAAPFLSGLEGLQAAGNNQIKVGPTLNAISDENIFVIGDCASFVSEKDGARHTLPPTAQVANQQANYLAKHLPGRYVGIPMPPFAYRDLGALVSLSDYNAFGTLGEYGFFKGSFIRGMFAQWSHIYLYRRHQIGLHGFWKALLLWLAERLNRLVRPKIRLS